MMLKIRIIKKIIKKKKSPKIKYMIYKTIQKFKKIIIIIKKV